MKNKLIFKYAFICCIAYFDLQAQNQLYPDSFDISTLNGTNGFTVTGLSNHKQFGAEAQFIGDINNDGLEDLALITGTGTINSIEFAGAAYIIYGATSAYPTPFDLNTLDGTNGFVVEGTVYDERRGRSITGPGDINGDGIDDLIIGASSGEMIVLYGSATIPALITVNYVTEGTKGFIIDAPGSTMVASLGDVNGDNINDFITGVRPNDSWVIFGGSTNFPASIDVTWLDGTKGFRTGDFEGNIPAYKVGGAGDINNDGFNDILIGNWDSTDPAVSYILFGKGTAFDAIVDLEALDGTNGFSIDNNGGDFLTFVGTLGDINNDGIDDFFSETNAIYGSEDAFPAHFAQSGLDGTDGFVLPGSLTSAPIGDINNDGIDDFISYNRSGDELAYVVFGSTSGFPSPINALALDGTNGFIIDNLETTNIGRPISGGGDINGDGTADFVVSSPYPPASVGTGEAYIIFGGDHFAVPLNSGYPQAVNVTDSGFTMVVNGPETGTIHYAIYPSSTNTNSLDYDDILTGVGADASGDFLMNLQNSDVSKIITSLSSDSYFKIFLFLEDASGNRSEIYNVNLSTNTLGVEDALLSGIEIFPNPILTTINVAITKEAIFKLTTVSGQELQKGNLKNGNNSIDMSNASKGIYFLSIQTSEAFLTKKIIKN